MLTKRPDCNGLPDCDPPDTMNLVFSILAAFILFFGIDMVFYAAMGKGFQDPNTKETPDFVLIGLGTLIASILFTQIYAYYARRPRPSHTNLPLASRTSKGATYGVIIALTVFLPSVFIDYAVYEGISLGNRVIELAYRIVQFALVGVVIAHILKTDPK